MNTYGFINNTDMINLPAEKYWSFPKSYKGDPRAETREMIRSGNYWLSLKNDGHYARFIKDDEGNMRLQGRSESVNGGYLDKIEWVPQCQSFFDSLPNGTCLLGELYFPNQRGSRKVTTILGCLKEKALERQNKGEKLHYYVFDVWAYGGESYLDKTIEQRISKINELAATDFVEIAEYYKGEEAWTKLGEILDNGGEGMVATQCGSKPSPGKRTARKTLKVKMTISQTIDAFLDGSYKLPTREYNGKLIESWSYWENAKTGERFNQNMYLEYRDGQPWEPVTKAYFYNWASAVSISVMKDGAPFHIGWISGIPDQMKEEIITKNGDYRGQVYEISAMEVEKRVLSNKQVVYSLRHGKFVGPRPDKRAEDCDFSQIA